MLSTKSDTASVGGPNVVVTLDHFEQLLSPEEHSHVEH